MEKKRIESFSEERKSAISWKDGRNAEITVDLVLHQARARLSDNKVNGPEDDVSS